MKLEYRPRVVKQLKRLPGPEKKKMVGKLEELAKNPLAGKVLRGKYKGLRSLKVWPYRIIYQVLKNKLMVFSIAHRQGAYN